MMEHYPLEKLTDEEKTELKKRAEIYSAANKEFYAAQAAYIQELEEKERAEWKRRVADGFIVNDPSLDWDYERCCSYRNHEWTE